MIGSFLSWKRISLWDVLWNKGWDPQSHALMSRAVHVQASESTGSSCSTNPKAKLRLAGGGPRQAQP